MADKSSKSGKEQRAQNRATNPVIYLKIGEEVFASINWSLGGILIDGYEGYLSPGSLLSVTGIGTAKGKLTNVLIQARVIRADANIGHLAIHILEIDNQAYAVLQLLMAKKMDALKKIAHPEAN